MRRIYVMRGIHQPTLDKWVAENIPMAEKVDSFVAFRKAIDSGRMNVVVSTKNLFRLWELAPFVAYAREQGLKVTVVTCVVDPERVYHLPADRAWGTYCAGIVRTQQVPPVWGVDEIVSNTERDGWFRPVGTPLRVTDTDILDAVRRELSKASPRITRLRELVKQQRGDTHEDCGLSSVLPKHPEGSFANPPA